STDLPIERYWRYVRHTRIGEGSQEMMKFVLARNILRD
ncbi:MAG: acyl-CoA/acyl-ACP dehydrogenase, partial [Chloroflexi bacterium]|nr:acyl-CoA/acyl-ACP dehydrogenase [Chloroflexota bacterium]